MVQYLDATIASHQKGAVRFGRYDWRCDDSGVSLWVISNMRIHHYDDRINQHHEQAML